MKLNKNSWYYWLYDKTYYAPKPPSNLCPFFWKLVLAMLMFPFLFILTLPYEGVKLLENEGEKVNYLEQEPLFLGGVLWILLYLLFCMVATFFTNNETIDSVAWVCWVGLGGIAIAVIIARSIMYLFRRKRHSEPKEYIAIEFIKAKYNKYCPKIDWE